MSYTMSINVAVSVISCESHLFFVAAAFARCCSSQSPLLSQERLVGSILPHETVYDLDQTQGCHTFDTSTPFVTWAQSLVSSISTWLF